MWLAILISPKRCREEPHGNGLLEVLSGESVPRPSRFLYLLQTERCLAARFSYEAPP